MDLNKIISQSFAITGKYRHLWLLSFLTIIGGVAYEQKFSLNLNIPTDILSEVSTDSIETSLKSIYSNVEAYIPIILIIIISLFVIWIILFIIGLNSKAGMIDSIIKIDQNRPTNFSDSFSSGQNFVWRFILLRLLYNLAIIALAIISFFVFILTIFLFFITIPVIWMAFVALNVLYKNAEILIVKQNLGVIESIKKTWQLLVDEWKNIGILWLINLAFGIALGVAQFLFVFITIFFTVFIGILAALFIISLENYTAIIVGVIIASIIVLLMIGISLFISSIIYTFFTTYWTLGISSITPILPLNKFSKNKK
jgi:hypothetical protein